MKAFFDTNVLVAAVTTDTDRSQAAVELLNEVDDGGLSGRIRHRDGKRPST